MGSVSVSSCRCCMFVSCVHPVAVLNAAFCMTCSLLMLVEDAIGDHTEQRSQSIHLQQPYLESDQNTVGQFLFDKENIEEKKELLFTIWKIRQHEMKRIQIK